MTKENQVKKMIVEYEDGTTDEYKAGVMAAIEERTGKVTAIAIMALDISIVEIALVAKSFSDMVVEEEGVSVNVLLGEEGITKNKETNGQTERVLLRAIKPT